MSEHHCPSSGRLQLSGGVLITAGFFPGDRYNVRRTPSGISLCLADDGTYQVTGHTPKSAIPKTYVPSALAAEFGGALVQAKRTRHGRIMITKV